MLRKGAGSQKSLGEASGWASGKTLAKRCAAEAKQHVCPR